MKAGDTFASHGQHCACKAVIIATICPARTGTNLLSWFWIRTPSSVVSDLRLIWQSFWVRGNVISTSSFRMVEGPLIRSKPELMKSSPVPLLPLKSQQ